MVPCISGHILRSPAGYLKGHILLEMFALSVIEPYFLKIPSFLLITNGDDGYVILILATRGDNCGL